MNPEHAADEFRGRSAPSCADPSPGLALAVGKMRQSLLDIGKRNRLTNTPLGKKRTKQIDIQDERADEVFRTLCRRGKKMTFAPAVGDGDGDGNGNDLAEETVPIFVPEASRGAAPAARHTDTVLQTRLTPDALHKRLLSLYREARSLEEEQGVSVLFLGMGFLRYFESESSGTERFAPLVLLPVDLDRETARGRFRLAFRDQDLETNLSLQKLLDADFDLKLPDLPEGDEWLPSDYFHRVHRAIAAKPRWHVQDDSIELSFYSFAKFLMYRDLDPENEWGEGLGYGNPLVESLLVGGFESVPSLFAPDENLDQRFPDPSDLKHILDADASQAQVIAAARDGKDLVVQGPPGTGKSQTIANIVAEVVSQGKRVLFVAEKRAALDVVHDRLEKCGLGPLCLELHSHKANKRHVYGELKQTLDLGRPEAVDVQGYEQVRKLRDELNRITGLLHAVDETTGDTPYGAIGAITRLHQSGCPPPDFRIEGAASWDGGGFDERVGAIARLAGLTAELGSEREHLWRGTRKRLNPVEMELVAQEIARAERSLDAFCRSMASARTAAGVDFPSFASAEDAAEQLDALASIPKLAPELLESRTLREELDAVVGICGNIAELKRLEASLLETLVESALDDPPWDEERSLIGQFGRSWFVWFRPRYRAAVARLRSVHRGQPPERHDARLEILDRLLEYRRRKRRVGKDEYLGRDALGRRFRGEETDAEGLLPALRWIRAQAERLGSVDRVSRQLEDLPADADPGAIARELRAARNDWRGSWEAVVERLDLDLAVAFGAEEIAGVAIAEVRARIEAWRRKPEAIQDWFLLGPAGLLASELGLDELRFRVGDGRVAPQHAKDTLRFVRALAVWERLVGETPELQKIDGDNRTLLVEQFQDSDRKLQSLAAREIALRHFESLPEGSAGQIGIVRGEANKKTRHMPIRKLLDKAGEAVASIKPVFLMSPLSVAQYLRPGGLTFDLVLMDEASQVRPQDGLGAVMRGRQVVVVGDQKQLPPTSFFDRQIAPGEDDDEDDEEAIQAGQIGDMESILALCEARGMAGGMLRWHYRSKHPSLIEVSNQVFYDHKLIFPPSPAAVGNGLGLSLQEVEGVYDRGRKRNNPAEAAVIANEVLAHAGKRPDETLGVVALSVAQRDAILDRIEYLRSEYPELDAFCKESNEDPFFVKNLENVQGDERDVIFISIGYGRDAGGYMSQSFGPVSSEGGERRLNVLFTRAKARCRVFSSIGHGDIRLDATKHAGPRVLKRFLKFAETGEIDIPVLTEGEADSPFEEAVAVAVRSHGYRVTGQVGSAGFRIDLAVHDPDDEGRFLLAIECDGARYHSSRWARERDRLRQAVLEQKGWIFHRIWSTDWFYRQKAELGKLLAAIDRARASRASREAPAALSPKPRGAAPGGFHGPEAVVRRAPRVERREPQRHPYEEAGFEARQVGLQPITETSETVIRRHVVKVVEVESPVHVEEVARRLARLWGYRRTGKRIRDAVCMAAVEAVRRGEIRAEDPRQPTFLERLDGPKQVIVRDRSRVASAKLRSVEMLPPSEIEAAILEAVARNVGIEGGDCAREVARRFGIKSTSAAMRECVQRHADRLVGRGRLLRSGAEYRLADAQSSFR